MKIKPKAESFKYFYFYLKKQFLFRQDCAKLNRIVTSGILEYLARIIAGILIQKHNFTSNFREMNRKVRKAHRTN